MATIDLHRPQIDLTGDSKRLRREKLTKLFFFVAAATSVAISAAIVLSLVQEAISFYTTVDTSSLFSKAWAPRRDLFDLRTLVVGTLIIVGIAMVVAVPLGLGAAMYLSEYASPRARKVLKPIVEVLAGIPSIVLAFFALVWITPEVVRKINEGATTANMLAAGIGVGILVVPIIASISEDAMRAVP